MTLLNVAAQALSRHAGGSASRAVLEQVSSVRHVPRKPPPASRPVPAPACGSPAGPTPRPVVVRLGAKERGPSGGDPAPAGPPAATSPQKPIPRLNESQPINKRTNKVSWAFIVGLLPRNSAEYCRPPRPVPPCTSFPGGPAFKLSGGPAATLPRWGTLSAVERHPGPEQPHAEGTRAKRGPLPCGRSARTALPLFAPGLSGRGCPTNATAVDAAVHCSPQARYVIHAVFPFPSCRRRPCATTEGTRRRWGWRRQTPAAWFVCLPRPASNNTPTTQPFRPRTTRADAGPEGPGVSRPAAPAVVQCYLKGASV